MGTLKLVGWVIGLSGASGVAARLLGTPTSIAAVMGVAGGVGLVGLFYLALPMLILNMMSMDLDPDQMAEVPREAVPCEVMEWLESVEVQLEAMGFLSLG